MKKLALVLLVCVVLPVPDAVIAQQARAPRMANDRCYPRVDDYGWGSIDICEVQIFDNSAETYIGGLSPAWSPDGLRFAYLASGLYVYDRTTNTSAMVTEGLPLSGPVSWSRDGAHLALLGSFEGASGWTQELVVIDPDGSNLTRLTHGVGFLGTRRMVTERPRDRVRPLRWRLARTVRHGCGRMECDAPYVWGWLPRRHQLVPRR